MEVFQVYAHQNIHTGVPFYIGSGKLGRAYSKVRRNKDWDNEVELIGEYDVRIIKEFDDVDKARSFEEKLLHFYGLRKHGGLLTNRQFMTKGHNYGYKYTLGQLEKKSEVMTEVWQRPGMKEKHSDIMSIIATEVNNRPEKKEAQRMALCHFYKITVCSGHWFIVNGSREGERILKEMGYNISYGIIQTYANKNATLEVPEPFTGRNYPHPKGSINILIVPSTLQAYEEHKNITITTKTY